MNRFIAASAAPLLLATTPALAQQARDVRLRPEPTHGDDCSVSIRGSGLSAANRVAVLSRRASVA